MENKDFTVTGKGSNQNKIIAALICGILGCICICTGDWLMIYGDTSYSGNLLWLTQGVAQIAPWRNSLAMLLAFPGIIFYGIALFAIESFLKNEKQRKVWHYLTALGLTPWLCLHLFYIMILYAFEWLNGNGFETAAISVSEAIFSHLSWIVILSGVIMIPPYIYWFWLLLRNNSIFPRLMAISNPLIFYVLLKLSVSLMPDCAFRLAFINGLMSESMAIWFGVMIVWSFCCISKSEEEK